MVNVHHYEQKIKEMIDELKGLCNSNGLSNQASEEVVITSVFLYKFLNDKFMSNLRDFSEDIGISVEEILKNENDEMDAFYDSYPQDVAFTYDETIEFLVNKVNNDDFYKMFDEALVKISNDTRNDAFSIDKSEGGKTDLFTPITELVPKNSRNAFAKSIFAIISQEKFDFGETFNGNFDFYAAIFEYLIKDYNVASGVYAEYFTPQAISYILNKIMVSIAPVEDKIYEIYDPCAGSGSLILHLANELGTGSFGDKAIVYTQDISAKSTRFLRLNMLLNGLKSSLNNIVEGNTLTSPRHYNINHDATSGFKKFDYITSNPPFKVDFSSTRDSIENSWRDGDRFFAGIPKIKPKKKDSMEIYLCFIQHILWSLKEDGKAAIVVPTGFITAQSGIEFKIRKHIVDNGWLKGVISFPGNIFANTGTNVSVLFIDKSNETKECILIDASSMGEKIKDGKNQRVVLSDEEINKIIDTFIEKEEIEDFSVIASYVEIKEKKYTWSAGQYFDIKIEYLPITEKEFNEKVEETKNKLEEYFNLNAEIEIDILELMGELQYEK